MSSGKKPQDQSELRHLRWRDPELALRVLKLVVPVVKATLRYYFSR
jgi:hypothetical protein